MLVALAVPFALRSIGFLVVRLDAAAEATTGASAWGFQRSSRWRSTASSESPGSPFSLADPLIHPVAIFMLKPQIESRGDRVIQGLCALVIGLNLFSTLLVIISDCSAIFGLLLWAVGAATFVFGILFPELVRLASASVVTRTILHSLLALLAVGLPVTVFYFENYSHIAGCVG